MNNVNDDNPELTPTEELQTDNVKVKSSDVCPIGFRLVLIF